MPGPESTPRPSIAGDKAAAAGERAKLSSINTDATPEEAIRLHSEAAAELGESDPQLHPAEVAQNQFEALYHQAQAEALAEQKTDSIGGESAVGLEDTPIPTQ